MDLASFEYGLLGIVGLVVMLGKQRGTNYTLYKPWEGCWYLWRITTVSVLHSVYVDLHANGYIPALLSLLEFSVSVITSVSCYSVSATTSIFLNSIILLWLYTCVHMCMYL